MIHPTAIIDPSAKLGAGNYVGPFCVIGPDVEIGDGNRFEAYVSIGLPGQHRTAVDRGGVVIGNNNVFREWSTVHAATQLLRPTVVADNGYFMANAHIAHDCLIEDGVTMCNNATLGGHTTVMRGATLGFGATVHQYQVIGAYSMLGMGTIVPKHAEILPGEMYAGNPAKHIGPNTVGLERNGVTAQARKAEHERYRVLRRQW